MFITRGYAPHNPEVSRLRLVPAALLALLLSLLTALLAAPAASATPDAAPSASPSARELARAAGIPATLRVGTEGVYSPFSYHDESGKLTGYDVELVQAIGERLGSKVEFVETPWDSIFAALQAGRFDLVANQVTYNEKRKQLYDLSDPYVVSHGVVLARTSDSSITKLADLKGKTTAQNATSSWADVARNAGAKVESIAAMDQAIALVESGRVDAIVNDELAVKNYLATSGKTDVHIAATTPDSAPAVYAAKKGSGYMPAINKAIAEVKADGTEKAIFDRYFSPKRSGSTTWDVVRSNLWPMLRATVLGTIPLAAISFVVGLALALLVALARMSRRVLFSAPARAFISLVRGTPLLVQLFIIFYALPQLGLDVPPWPAAIVAFSLNVAGYAAEIIRAAVEAVDKGQWEAGSSVGLTHTQTLREVVLPQAARVAVPPLSNTLISLVKDTSLASTILVTELMRQAQVAASPTFQFLALYSVAAVVYWVICLALSLVQGVLERRLSRHVGARVDPVLATPA